MGRHCARSTCPFCGWHYTNMLSGPGFVLGKGNTERYRVKCCSCEALGPMKDTREEAAEAWNARPERRDRHGDVEGGEGLDFRDMLR